MEIKCPSSPRKSLHVISGYISAQLSLAPMYTQKKAKRAHTARHPSPSQPNKAC